MAGPASSEWSASFRSDRQGRLLFTVAGSRPGAPIWHRVGPFRLPGYGIGLGFAARAGDTPARRLRWQGESLTLCAGVRQRIARRFPWPTGGKITATGDACPVRAERLRVVCGWIPWPGSSGRIPETPESGFLRYKIDLISCIYYIIGRNTLIFIISIRSFHGTRVCRNNGEAQPVGRVVDALAQWLWYTEFCANDRRSAMVNGFDWPSPSRVQRNRETDADRRRLSDWTSGQPGLPITAT